MWKICTIKQNSATKFWLDSLAYQALEPTAQMLC